MKRIEISYSQHDESTNIEFWDNGILDEIFSKGNTDPGFQKQLLEALKNATRNLLICCRENLFVCDVMRKGKSVRSFLISATDEDEAENLLRYENDEAISLEDIPLFKPTDTLSCRQVDPTKMIVKI